MTARPCVWVGDDLNDDLPKGAVRSLRSNFIAGRWLSASWRSANFDYKTRIARFKQSEMALLGSGDGTQYVYSDDDGLDESGGYAESGDDIEIVRENKRLKTENAKLKSVLIRELGAMRASHKALLFGLRDWSGALPDGAAPGSQAPALGLKLVQTFSLGVFGQRTKRELMQMQAPKRFSSVGSFPHALVFSERTQCRELQVEARRPVTLKFQLVDSHGKTVVDHGLEKCGVPEFRLSIRNAATDEEISPSDFAKTSIKDLCDPMKASVDTRRVVEGELVFSFRFLFTSRDATAKNCSFYISVAPTDDAIAAKFDLGVSTPPFVLRAKVSNRE